MNRYQSFTDKDLAEAYDSMMDYSGKINDDLLAEIERRGGGEIFAKKTERRKLVDKETQRISNEVYALSNRETELDFVQKLVQSDVFTKEELDRLVEEKFTAYQATLKNRAVTSKTIIGSIAAAALSSIAGAIFFVVVLNYVYPLMLISMPVVYLINYFIIWLITRQTRSNWVIFIVTLAATIASVFIGFYIASLILPVPE